MPKKEPAVKVKIDARAMHKIRDIAHKIWLETRKPNANLIMYEALRVYLFQLGYDPEFEIPAMDTDA